MTESKGKLTKHERHVLEFLAATDERPDLGGAWVIACVESLKGRGLCTVQSGSVEITPAGRLALSQEGRGE